MHHPKCLISKGSCCSWIAGGCECQCTCESIFDVLDWATQIIQEYTDYTHKNWDYMRGVEDSLNAIANVYTIETVNDENS